MIYYRDTYVFTDHHRFDADSEFLREISRSWDERLKDAFRQMPPIAWAANWDRPKIDNGSSHMESSSPFDRNN